MQEQGLHVIVLADWFGSAALTKMRFFDDNTHSWWDPLTGGANIPALNTVLDLWGLSLSDGVFSGEYSLKGHAAAFVSGSVLRTAPSGAAVVSALLTNDLNPSEGSSLLPVLALLPSSTGRLAVYGDSNCVDDATGLGPARRCDWLIQLLLEFVTSGQIPPALLDVSTILDSNLTLSTPIATRPWPSGLYQYSRVLSGPGQTGAQPTCERISWQKPLFAEPNSSLEALLQSHLDRRADLPDKYHQLSAPPLHRAEGGMSGALFDFLSMLDPTTLVLLAALAIAAAHACLRRSRLIRAAFVPAKHY